MNWLLLSIPIALIVMAIMRHSLPIFQDKMRYYKRLEKWRKKNAN